MVREPDGGSRWTPSERTWGELADYAPLLGSGLLSGREASPALYIETFVPADSVAVLTFGSEPCGVTRSAGEGSSMLIGSIVGHQGNAYRDPKAAALLEALLRWGGVTREGPAKTDAGKARLLRRRRITADREAWFFTNPHEKPLTESVDVTGFARVTDLLGAAVEKKRDTVALSVAPLDVRVLVLER
jgi:hypothetical protein